MSPQPAAADAPGVPAPADTPGAPADPETILLKVGSASDPRKVAQAIIGSIFGSHTYPQIRAIGHGAVGQAAKAVAIARGSAATQGVNLSVQIGFVTIKNDENEDISAIVFDTFARR